MKPSHSTHASFQSTNFSSTQAILHCGNLTINRFTTIRSDGSSQHSCKKVSVAEVKVDKQSAPQSKEIKTVEINFYEHEVYAADKLIADICHDSADFVTQRWMVMVGDKEIHRAESWAKCYEFIQWHYKQGTLPVYEPTQTQELVVANPVKVAQTEVVEPSAVVTTAQKRNINHRANSEIAICF